MKRIAIGFALVSAVLLTAVSATAASGKLRAHPYEYNPGNAAVDITAEWRPGAGLADASGKANQGLILGMSEDVAFPPGASAAAEIKDVDGVLLESLSFDHKLGTQCSGGVPRFTVETDTSSGYFQCSDGTHSAIGLTGWEHIVFDCTDWTGTGPCPIGGPDPLTFLEIQQDIAGAGASYNDNLEVNGCIMGKPGNCP